MEFCLADAFHPGCEMTWPMRPVDVHGAVPLGARADWLDWSLPRAGADQQFRNIPNGPLYGQVPGGITRWMAMPWQTDTASCRSGYDKTYGPYVPTFWPARVPNRVMTKENYAVVITKSARSIEDGLPPSPIAPHGSTHWALGLHRPDQQDDRAFRSSWRRGSPPGPPRTRHSPRISKSKISISRSTMPRWRPRQPQLVPFGMIPRRIGPPSPPISR